MPRQHSPAFLSTHWSAVVEAGDASDGGNALAELCRGYWYPIYAYVRGRGYQSVDAEDLTQAFFADLIETRSFSTADPTKGKFRFFLLGAMKHFMANEWKRGQRLKRGGGALIFSLDELTVTQSNQLDLVASSGLDAQSTFEKHWGETLVALVFERLRHEFSGKGKELLYNKLIVHLSGHIGEASYKQSAYELNISVSAVKSAIHRLRQHYAQIFREEVARTLAPDEDVDDEIRY